MSDRHSGDAPGWDAITAAFEDLYGVREPAAHWAPLDLGDSEPLAGVSCYLSREGAAHWHYVSYGLTELYQKENDDPKLSGFGFELTVRVLMEPGEDEPPLWPVSLLQNLARYVFASGNRFGPGHHMPGEGPLGEDESELSALAFTTDPALPPRQSPNGDFSFVHLVGITLDELQAIELWDTEAFLLLVREETPRLITDLRRESYLERPAFAERVRVLSERDGASCGALNHEEFGFRKSLGRQPVLLLTAKDVSLFCKLLPRRLLHGNPLTLFGRRNFVRFELASQNSQRSTDGGLIVQLDASGVREVSTVLRPNTGTYTAAGFEWRVGPGCQAPDTSTH